MKHDLEAFSREIVALINRSGDTGPSGDKLNKPLLDTSFFVPTPQTLLSPLIADLSPDVASSADRENEYSQRARTYVPCVPTATNVFRDDQIPNMDHCGPAEWHAVLAELERREPVAWLGGERWAVLLSDGGSFVMRWGGVAHSLGWTSLDLFGVHPIAPAVRFDVMGLIPTLNRAEVLALTCQTATIRRTSGAVLTYRRLGRADAILISDIRQ